jgi:hypothetical protein
VSTQQGSISEVQPLKLRVNKSYSDQVDKLADRRIKSYFQLQKAEAIELLLELGDQEEYVITGSYPLINKF